MRRLLPILVAVILLSGCNWYQGWHHERSGYNGSSPTETLILFQNDVVDYQGDYLAWAAYVVDLSPAIGVTVVDTCPGGYNCVVWTTAEADPYAAKTGIAPDGNSHIVVATVTLDPTVGVVGSVTQNMDVACHEALHALGGGYDPSSHTLCNGSGWPTQHDYDEIFNAYNHYH